jgi:hypothetical protein
MEAAGIEPAKHAPRKKPAATRGEAVPTERRDRDKRERCRSSPRPVRTSTFPAMRGRKQMMRQGHTFQTLQRPVLRRKAGSGGESW